MPKFYPLYKVKNICLFKVSGFKNDKFVDLTSKAGGGHRVQRVLIMSSESLAKEKPLKLMYVLDQTIHSVNIID